MSYITTYTGKHFNPAQPDREKIDIRDIAHALPMICRGNGHVKTFFSVGQHCIHCALEAEARGYSRRLILACLLHDASECYLSDVPRPVKSGMPGYKAVEERLLEQVYIKYLGSALAEQEERLVKQVDNDMLYYDMLNLLNERFDQEPPVMLTVFSYEVLPFEQVEGKYLELFERYRHVGGIKEETKMGMRLSIEGMKNEMTFDSEHFTVHYCRECANLVERIAEALRGNMQRIMGFLRLDNLDRKIPVVLYSDTDAYVAHIEECGQRYYDWMIADTFDGRIHILSLEACRSRSSHAGMDEEEYTRLIVHEFVHICQQQVEPNCYGCIWFWEALATNLAGQEHAPVEILCNREELMFHYQELPNAYAVSYLLGKYMLEHMSPQQIYDYIRRPAQLWEDTEKILQAATLP